MEVKLNNIDEKAQSPASVEIRSSVEENLQNFDLRAELHKINCLHHYESLLHGGYSDKGAFCHLDNGILADKGLWIQKKDRIKILAVGASFRHHFDQHIEATGMNKHRFFRHHLSPATNEGIACGGEDNAEKCESSSLPAIHPPKLQRKIDNIRRKTAVDTSGFLENYSPQVMEGPYCCQKHKDTLHAHHLKHTELMRHHAETNLRSVIARADSDLYNNGFLPRTVLRKIAIDYLLIEGGPNRYYPCDSHSAPSAAILMNLRIRKQPSPSVEVISSKTVSKFAVPTYDEKLAEFDDHILRASMIEGEDIETLLDSCILDSERLYHTLSWAGEFERRGLCNINHSLRAEPWDFARPGSGEITLETTDNSRSSSRSDVMKNPLLLSSKVSPQLRYSADTLFYCPDTFCRLLLIMMDKKRNKYCHKNELFAV